MGPDGRLTGMLLCVFVTDFDLGTVGLPTCPHGIPQWLPAKIYVPAERQTLPHEGGPALVLCVTLFVLTSWL